MTQTNKCRADLVQRMLINLLLSSDFYLLRVYIGSAQVKLAKCTLINKKFNDIRQKTEAKEHGLTDIEKISKHTEVIIIAFQDVQTRRKIKQIFVKLPKTSTVAPASRFVSAKADISALVSAPEESP